MDPVSLSMLNLRIAQFLAAGREPTPIDRDRLKKAAAFLDRILSAMAFFSEGEIEALDETAFSEARKTCQTLVRLKKLSTTPAIHEYISTVRASLQGLIDESRPPKHARDQMQFFFSGVARGLADDAVGGDPILVHFEDEPEASSATAV